MHNPCLRCGACCAHFRVSFYWREAEPGLMDGVPVKMTEPLDPYRCAMRGTLRAPVRCVALEGRIGENVGCTIYDRRASPCREVLPGDEKCDKARATHGLPKLFRTADHGQTGNRSSDYID